MTYSLFIVKHFLHLHVSAEVLFLLFSTLSFVLSLDKRSLHQNVPNIKQVTFSLLCGDFLIL